jgi:hypothetical protein
MAGFTFTGVTNLNQINTSILAVGSTRWNQTDNCFEAFDGTQWTQMTNGKNETLQDIVQHAEDRVATTIDLEYADNVTIQDAYKAWEAANERFMIVLALAEKQ